MARLNLWLRWATGWTLIASFYAHSFIGSDTATVTPVVAAVLAILMTVSATLGLLRPPAPSAPTTFRRMALYFLVAAIAFWILTSIFHYFVKPPTTRDLGEFGIYCLIPILLLLNRDRAQLITFVGRLCVVMALADLGFNLLVIAHLVAPVNEAGYIFNGLSIARYPGISGGVLSAGEVGLVAVIYAAWRTRCDPKKIPTSGWYLILAACFLGLYLVDARRYSVAAVFGAFVLLFPRFRIIPLPFYAILQGGIGLYVSFMSSEPEEILRSRLMIAAFHDVIDKFWFGRGPIYLPPGVASSFAEMWSGGVTESGVLDVALAFGVPATVIFFAAVFVALLAKRATVSWMPVLVTVLLGTFPFNNPLSFLGSVLFFGSLLCVIMQEVPRRVLQKSARGDIGILAMMPS